MRILTHNFENINITKMNEDFNSQFNYLIVCIDFNGKDLEITVQIFNLGANLSVYYKIIYGNYYSD